MAAVFIGPQLWVKRVFAQHRAPREDLPGTGGELARHLLDRFHLGTGTSGNHGHRGSLRSTCKNREAHPRELHQQIVDRRHRRRTRSRACAPRSSGLSTPERTDTTSSCGTGCRKSWVVRDVRDSSCGRHHTGTCRRTLW